MNKKAIKLYCVLFFCLFSLQMAAQVPDNEELYRNKTQSDSLITIAEKVDTDTLIKVNDLRYREDQFYMNLTYNLLQSRPEGVSQNSFSAGFHFGFLRDMPINSKRTFAIAAGLGYSFNNYKQNLAISESNGVYSYQAIPDDVNFDKNKLALHYIELPIEFRWRTSTVHNHKFWRVYTGVKLSYLAFSQSKYEAGDVHEYVKGNTDLNKFRYGAYLACGYNTWNFYAYYGLNPIFKSSAKMTDGKALDMSNLNVGLMFYIL